MKSFKKSIMNIYPEAVTQRCSVKWLFLDILQSSKRNICAGVSFLINLQASDLPATLLKKRIWHRCFHVNFAKFLRIPFLTKHLWCLFLFIRSLHNETYLEICISLNALKKIFHIVSWPLNIEQVLS